MRHQTSEATMVRRVLSVGGLLAVGFGLLFVVFSTSYTIDDGERGVVLRNGAFQEVAEPGWHVKIPVIDTVEVLSIRDQIWGGDATSYSRDQQPAQIDVTVNWRIDEGMVGRVYSEFGSLEALQSRIIAARTPQAVRTVFGQFNAVTAISDRARLNNEVEELVREETGNLVIVDDVQLSINFSQAYETQIEERMRAEVEVEKLRQNAVREQVQAEITVTKAKAEADSVRARAEAEADALNLRSTAEANAITVIGDAEASALAAKAKAISNAPELVNLMAVERWTGELPTTMMPDGSLPFVNVQ